MVSLFSGTFAGSRPWSEPTTEKGALPGASLRPAACEGALAEARVRRIEEAKAVAARLGFEKGKELAVEQNGVAVELGYPGNPPWRRAADNTPKRPATH
jgi:hypothetical protein